MVESAVEDDGLDDFPTPARAAAVVRALRGDGRAAREALPADEGSDEDPQDLAYHAYALAVVCDAEGDVSAALPHARRAVDDPPGPDDGPLRPRLAPRRPRGARAGRPRGSRRGARPADGRYDGEIPADGARRAPAGHGPAGRGPRGAGGRDRGRRDGPAGGRVAVPPGARPARPRRGAARAGKDPADVVAEAATIGTALGSPQVVERAESLRPRPPGDARTAP